MASCAVSHWTFLLNHESTLFYILSVLFVAFALEYTLHILAGRANPKMNHSIITTVFTAGRLLDIVRILIFVLVVLRAAIDVGALTGNYELAATGEYNHLLRGSASSFGLPWQFVHTTAEAAFLNPWLSVALALSIFRVLEYQYFRDAGPYLADALYDARHLLISASVCALFLFFVGGVLWWLSEWRYNANFHSVPQALFFGAIFTLSEWADADFTITGKILCRDGRGDCFDVGKELCGDVGKKWGTTVQYKIIV